MSDRWIHKPASLGLGLATLLAAALSGCGGSTADKSDAVLVSSPDAKTGAKATPAPTTGTTASSAGGTAGNGASTAGGGTSSAPVASEGWGTLKGKVVFGGTPPEQPLLAAVGKAAKDPEVCAKTEPIKNERLVVDSGTKGVKNVFVYLTRPTAVNDEAKKAALAKHADFDQKNCTFIPHALAVMTGTTVTMKSSDSTNHNVNFQLKSLNLNPTMAPGHTMDVKPEEPERGPGPIICSIHPWMSAYWLVLDHPYFAVTDKDGNFEIKNVPAGTQKLVVWHEAAQYVTPSAGDSITIKANDTTTKDFTIDPAKLKPGG
jgi:plastocyanin